MPTTDQQKFSVLRQIINQRLPSAQAEASEQESPKAAAPSLAETLRLAKEEALKRQSATASSEATVERQAPRTLFGGQVVIP